MNILDHIESVYKGDIIGDIPSIISDARRVLQDQFSSGYYQDFPFEECRAKEVELKGKPKRLPKGARARANPPRMRGVLPNVEDSHVDDDVGDLMQHEGGVHLDDDNEAEAREARDRSFCPRWNLLSSNDSVLNSPLCEHTDKADVNQSPPLSHPTFFLFTQSQDPLEGQPHSLLNQAQAPLQEQQPPAHYHQPPVHQEVQQQSELQQQVQQHSSLQQPAQKLPVQKLRLQKRPVQNPLINQLTVQPANQVLAQQQPAQQLPVQPEAPREQLHMKLRARKHAPPDCGTAGKKELDTYKRR